MNGNTEREKNEYNLQLYERAKELKCMYMVDEVLQNKKLTLPAALTELVHTVPTGFTVPSACRVKITVWNDEYCAKDFSHAEILYSSPLTVMDKCVGEIAVGYIKALLENGCDLLSDEIKLLDAIALRISRLIADTQRE